MVTLTQRCLKIPHDYNFPFSTELMGTLLCRIDILRLVSLKILQDMVVKQGLLFLTRKVIIAIFSALDPFDVYLFESLNFLTQCVGICLLIKCTGVCLNSQKPYEHFCV